MALIRVKKINKVYTVYRLDWFKVARLIAFTSYLGLGLALYFS